MSAARAQPSAAGAMPLDARIVNATTTLAAATNVERYDERVSGAARLLNTRCFVRLAT